MTGLRLWLIGIAAVMLVGLEGAYIFLNYGGASQPASVQQPATAARQEPNDPRVLASRFMSQMHADQMALSAMLGPGRIGVIALLQRSGGMTEQAAGQVFDRYMAPEFKARLPELQERLVDILVQDFTPDELRSIVDNRQDDARRTAGAKAGQLQGQFQQAGQTWGEKIGADVFRRNAGAITALGLKTQAAGK